MKSKVISILLSISLLNVFNNIYAQYHIDQIQGIWVIDENLNYTEQPCLGYDYNIFHKNKHLYVSSCDTNIDDNIQSVQICYVGFVNSDSDVNLREFGNEFVFSDDAKTFEKPTYFQVFEKEEMYIGYQHSSYLTHLPKKAQIVLYKRSLFDHCNYAREFLEYDICGVNNNNVNLLDSLQNETDIVIDKEDIVVVRNTTGALLQVEYESEPNKYIKGYLKRKDLQFVEENK